MGDKIFCNLNQLIDTQAKRGLSIINDERTREIIRYSGYYNIFNRYKDPFLDCKLKEEKYLKNVSFHEIYELNRFDHKIRIIFFEYILIIESNVKSIIASEFSKVYGHKDYLMVKNFNNTVNEHSHTNLEERNGKILELISSIQQEIAKRLINKNLMIVHYITKYGYIPMWVLVNILTFGTISKFYHLMKDKDKNNVSKYYNIKPDQFESILKVLTEFRNACAHNERIFSLKILNKNYKPKYIPDLNTHKQLNIRKDASGNYICGKNDVFSIAIVFKHLLKKEDFLIFVNSLVAEFKHLEVCLNSINIKKIYKIMGFPDNWEEIKNG